jgi:two-component system sensor histidine kinase KdpD
VRREGNALATSVADRGAGVPSAESGRIFEAFYRPTGMLPDVGGAGLGLAIARQLAEAQGGTVEYAPREGGGSVFTLRLPAVDDLDVTAGDVRIAPDGRNAGAQAACDFVRQTL